MDLDLSASVPLDPPASATLDQFATAKLEALDAEQLRRRLRVVSRDAVPSVDVGGRRLVSLSCNDVLGLSRHPRVVEAAIAATRRWGTGSGASRLVTGNTPPVAALEEALAAFKGTEAACVFGSGYLANLGVIPALAGRGDLIVLDALAHACLHAGARLSGAAVRLFPHNDVAALGALLAAERPGTRHCLVVTETVFSMDGDRAPLASLADVAERHDCWLAADDAHGLGVLGEGRGGAHEAGVGARIPLQLGTLSKALGGYGGYLCASRAVVELMHSRARPFIYSTGLPPAQAAAAHAALDVLAADPALAARPLALARRFTASAGLPLAASHIVPVIMGDAARALAAGAALEAEGFLAVAIRPPTVPAGTARLRLSFPAALGEDEVDRLAALVARLAAPPGLLAPA